MLCQKNVFSFAQLILWGVDNNPGMHVYCSFWKIKLKFYWDVNYLQKRLDWLWGKKTERLRALIWDYALTACPKYDFHTIDSILKTSEGKRVQQETYISQIKKRHLFTESGRHMDISKWFPWSRTVRRTFQDGQLETILNEKELRMNEYGQF